MILTIIGATSDVGREVARSFAKRGFDLYLVARQSGRLEPLQKDISIKSNVKVTVHELDLLDFDKYDSVLKPLAEKSEVVLFIAGYDIEQEKAEANVNTAMQIMDVNYKAGVLSLNIFKTVFHNL